MPTALLRRALPPFLLVASAALASAQDWSN